ncbi:sigma-70 family RNA polymerase sigma factor [Rhodococcus spelaei]|uniref:Sigma-70 family RNA polymerase sigma factor n=1 Tax=Rhodococcus spelaei TaxID=2546320 RepID=A0A541B0T2_9NOCA|nr:ECF RNA polymerase sigma factor SigK [Rhodococcus spelaei]TQF65918.1 sigma-70 family RNA polymerase sigma factor [Rhodococcus spelaei]
MTGPGRDRPGSASDAAAPADCPVDAGPAATARAAESSALATLVTASAAGDATAFAELYDRTSSRVYGMVLRVLRDRGFAEETTQEVYLQVWRAADTFDAARGSALSWLLTLAHRRAVDRVRSEQSSSDRDAAYEARNHLGTFDEVSEEVTRRFERQSVIDCLDVLTDTQRESVALAYYGGRTYREVAADLGVALPTVKTRIRDGLARLRGCLGVA